MSKAQFFLLALSFVSLPVLAAGKAVGTCSAEVTGPKTFKIEGKLYEGDVPEGTVKSGASSRAWMLKDADEFRPRSEILAKQRVELSETNMFVLNISCVSSLGQLTFMPYSANAKWQDYPAGPKTYPLVNPDAKGVKSGDLQAILLIAELGFAGVVTPKEPGTLTFTQNDGDKLVGSFEFHSAKYSVKGNFNFTRPQAFPK